MARHDLRCTDEELAAWKQAARIEGVSLGGLIRRLMNRFSGLGSGRQAKERGWKAEDGLGAAPDARGWGVGSEPRRPTR
jgi:hypothetical protein